MQQKKIPSISCRTFAILRLNFHVSIKPSPFADTQSRVQAAFQVQKAFKSSLHFYFLRLRSPGSSISAHFMILATSIGFSS